MKDKRSTGFSWLQNMFEPNREQNGARVLEKRLEPCRAEAARAIEDLKQKEHAFSAYLSRVPEKLADSFKRAYEAGCNALVQMEARPMAFPSDDRALWGEYSKRGGIYDTLMEIARSVGHPSINAFDYDEEEGMYNIYIILCNTHLDRFFALWEAFIKNRDLERAKSKDAYVSEYEAGKRAVLELSEKRDKILENDSGVYSKKLAKILSGQPLTADNLEKKQKDLKKLTKKAEERACRLEQFEKAAQGLERRVEEFAKEFPRNLDHQPEYGDLFQKLKELYASLKEDAGQFHGLMASPANTVELDAYMDCAKAFCESAARITADEAYKIE